MTTLWVDRGGARVARGDLERHDPGVGVDRFGRSLELLRSSNAETAFASFTFDPEAIGSTVLIAEEVSAEKPSPQPLNHSFEVVDDGLETWNRGFLQMMGAIGAGAVTKVVLARQVRIRSDRPIDPGRLAAVLADQNPESFTFAIDGLVGSSPELLVRVRNGMLTSNVLAGTASDDASLAGTKIAEEHELAATSAVQALEPHLEDLSISKSTVRQGGMSHVASMIRGRLLEGVTIHDVLARLHPTAAVGGTPRSEATELIREVEAPRGRYAGPVGWFDRNGEGVFAIALRCVAIADRDATLFAGGGLVAESDREAELAETEMKLRPVLDALSQ